MITIHHLGVSQSERIVWLCEELGLPYELKVYARDPSTMMAPLALQAVHPLGSAPVITEGQRVLAESSAIVEYLLERYGKGRLRPATSAPEFPDYLYWLHYANGSLMPNIMLGFILGMPLADNAVHPLAVMFGERVQRHFAGVITGDVERFELPNLHALNFLLHGALDGGGTMSLKMDAQGKVFSTAMLRMVLDVADDEARALGLDRKSTRLNSSHPRLSRMPSSA